MKEKITNDQAMKAIQKALTKRNIHVTIDTITATDLTGTKGDVAYFLAAGYDKCGEVRKRYIFVARFLWESHEPADLWETKRI